MIGLPSLQTYRLHRCSQAILFTLSKKYCKDTSSKNSGQEISINKDDKMEKENKKKEAQKKMNELLQSLSKNSKMTSEPVKLSRPKPRPKKTKETSKSNTSEDESNVIIDFSLKEAVKDVAASLDGDTKETESELLTALRSHSTSKASLSDLLSGMKIDKQVKQHDGFDSESMPIHNRMQRAPPTSSLHEYRKDLHDGHTSQRQPSHINLFDSPPLNIFPPDLPSNAAAPQSVLGTWDAAHEREKLVSVNRAPGNYFDELIQWTEQGKMWTFPVDNEDGLEEEKKFSFADHIFLEKNLEGWCPSKGPIRHFMELVCVGLSKNPYLTVTRKRAHIEWYKNYFESKAELLKDVGAM